MGIYKRERKSEEERDEYGFYIERNFYEIFIWGKRSEVGKLREG